MTYYLRTEYIILISTTETDAIIIFKRLQGDLNMDMEMDSRDRRELRDCEAVLVRVEDVRTSLADF